MILKNCSIEEFFQKHGEEKIICFGAGMRFGDMLRECEEYDVASRVQYIIDNNTGLHGKYRYYKGTKFYIKPVGEVRQNKEKFVIIILGLQFAEMLEQLDSIAELNNHYVYIYPFMQFVSKDKEKITIDKSEGQKIPKTIHYCWFGNNEMPENAKKCIETWKEKCPDYEIIRWDESNYDVSKHLYVKQAYDRKAWAFVSDYARLDIIYNYGGIYLDTDVSVIKRFDDLLYHDAYCGFLGYGTRINTGAGFGARKKFPIVGEWLDAYKYQVFEKDDCTVNGNLCTVYQTDVMKFHKGFIPNGKCQLVDGLACYSKEYFEAYNHILGLSQITENTYSIHWSNLSWCEVNQNNLKNNMTSSKSSVNAIMKRIKDQENY